MNQTPSAFKPVRLSEDRKSLIILDQEQLPNKEVFLELKTKEEIFEAIQSLKVRGAPALGLAVAYGLCVVMSDYTFNPPMDFFRKAERIIYYYESARPTAVNPAITLHRLRNVVMSALPVDGITSEAILELMYKEALKIDEEESDASEKIGESGISLLKPGWGVLTHCNAGKLAAPGFGTALSPLYLAQERNYGLKIYSTETRPLLQGARLTAYELSRAGADVTLLCDNAAASLMAKGEINAVMTGCDRIAANGDVANKIGTSNLAVLANHYKIPFYILGPLSTVDNSTPDGESVVIEERDQREVTEMWFKERMAPEKIKVYNPAFDITKAEMITAIITERGIYRYPYDFSNI